MISGIASIIAAATFIIPLLSSTDLEEGTMSTAGYALLFVMYVVLAYITIFFNAALVSAAHERLSGGDPTIGSAIRGAASRAGKILPWAIISATVSMILRAIEERAGFVGRIVAAFAGMAWAVVTFLVLPIIVIEGMSVTDAIKKSGSLFKRTWGENLAAQVGFSLVGFLAILPAIAIFVLGVGAGGATAAVAIVAGVLWVIAVSVVLAALSVIFQTALVSLCSGWFSADRVLQRVDHAIRLSPEARRQQLVGAIDRAISVATSRIVLVRHDVGDRARSTLTP